MDRNVWIVFKAYRVGKNASWNRPQVMGAFTNYNKAEAYRINLNAEIEHMGQYAYTERTKLND